jgi:hypothetical protein
MSTNITSTQLDFDNIKNKLKTFFAQQDEFSDYDFEASGLSNLLDVLAYNTHFNGLIANFALNEAFLTTAQLRSSVLSHAESLGYTPRSKTSSIAYLNLQITNRNSGRSPTATLPAGTRFSSTVDGVSYTFQTLVDHTATDDGNGVYRFQTSAESFDIPVVEGISTTKTFYVASSGERQIYIIPDLNADTSTLDVKVFNSASSNTFVQYTDLDKAVLVNPQTTYYDIHEAPNGFFELHFGDGLTTGRAPVAGNKIVVTYLSSNGSDSNRASAFTPINTVSMDGVSYTLSVSTAIRSAGGADKESIETIRQNAPIAYAAQQRLVTANDYVGLITNNYAAVEDVSAWGGEDNTPPEYGKAFVSLKFGDGVGAAAQQAIKDSIVNNLTNNLSIMSIDTKFVDPITAFIGCSVTFNYNPNLSTTPINIVETQVVTTIQNYFNDNLKTFGGTFRRSNILATIDDISPAVLDSRMDVTVRQDFTPALNAQRTYDVFFPMEIATPDSLTAKITSNPFTFNNVLCTIRNQLSSTKLQVVDVDGKVIVDNIGEYFSTSGRVQLVGFAPQSIQTGTAIQLTVTPANQSTVRPLRNYILDLNSSLTSARGVLDYQTTTTAL